MKKLIAAALSLLLVSACATGLSYVPASFNHIVNTSVLLENADGHGSGTVIAGNLVLTAGHVAEMGEMTMTLHDGTQRHVKPLWQSATRDVAVMQFDGDPIKEVAALDCKPVAYGEPVHWVGNPSILRFNYNRGFVSSPDLIKTPDGEVPGTVPFTGLINPGDSGSGMFSADGNLRGVGVAFIITNVGFFQSQSGNGLMVPTSEFCTDMLVGLNTASLRQLDEALTKHFN